MYKPQKKPVKVPKSQRRTFKNIPKGFDSWFEYDLSKVLRNCNYHTAMVEYVTKKCYEPDFIFYDDDKVIYIESKGRFRTREEASKYIHVRNSLSQYEELVFIFYNFNLAMPGARVRGNGTKQTHGEWATLNDFVWYTFDDIPAKFKVMAEVNE